MERIRQAVEQARRDREKSGLIVPPASTATTPAGSIHVPDAPAIKQPDYRHTKPVMVGSMVREQNRLVAAVEGHPLQDSYRMLRTRVLQEMKANNWRTIAVSSPTPGAGKTLTAVNLAIMIARDPAFTALLVDGDLRNPSVHRCFGYAPEFGLNDYLFNDVPLEDVLFHPDMQCLTVLPGRESIRESAETLASPKMVNLLAEVKGRYPDRIVVIDIAPVLSVDDALALRPNIDCMLLVVESGETKREELVRAIESMDPLPIVGTVLNKVSRKTVAAY